MLLTTPKPNHLARVDADWLRLAVQTLGKPASTKIGPWKSGFCGGEKFGGDGKLRTIELQYSPALSLFTED
jgi:hypothetical protein